MKNITLKNIIKKLKECTAEDVGMHGGTAVVYTELFTTICKSPCNRIFNCDGYWTLPPDFFGKDVHMLTEYKGDVNLKSHLELCKVLAQCVYYLKSFQDNAYTIPKIVFIGDKNKCVLVPTTAFFSNALNCGSDFSYSASSAASDEKLMKCLLDNYLLKTFPLVLDIDDDFDERSLVSIMYNIAISDATCIPLEINEHNINMVWKAFARNVFGSRTKVAPNEQVSIFVHFITNHDDFIIDRNNPKRFSLNGKVYDVNDPLAFGRFCRSFDHIRSVKQKEKLRATCDRFIEDNNRRMKGEFYTPTEFVDYAHDMIAKEFGEDWKEKYIVWDCAWGTGNLTRDYKFKELYCSTLEQSELDIAKNINPEATKFQFDFLNDDFEKLPEGLQKAFREKKHILSFDNPPYGTAQAGPVKGANKKGIAKTRINEMMLRDGIGSASQNIYAQFLYRIARLKEINPNFELAFFSPTLFLTGTAWKGFRKNFFDSFSFVNAIQFRADHFANVAANWGIMFSLWRNGICNNTNEFPCKCIDCDSNGNIVEIGNKTIYNNDNGKSCSDWIKENIKGLKGVDAPQMMSALNYRDTGLLFGSLVEGALGYYVNIANNVNKNTQCIYLLSSCAAQGHGISILPQNFDRVAANFSARRLIASNWMNWADEYMMPDTKDSRYAEFLNDSIVFSLFESKSNQSSLRSIEYKGKLWDIKNEFFWMSRNEVLDLADRVGFEELYNDAKQSEERFVYKKLQTLKLSEEAQAVIDKATEIVKKSFEYRKEVHDTRPEYHLNAWDAGWYQIKKLCSELPMMKDDMEEVKVLFKRLSDNMLPMVYELGFLKR